MCHVSIYILKDFSREDETEDFNFYMFPKLVYHIDEKAVGALK